MTIQNEKLSVRRDLNGGVQVQVGERAFVLSPEQAVAFAEVILRAAGMEVEFTDPVRKVLRPPAHGLNG